MSETQTDTSTGTESGGGFAFTGKVAEFREGSTIQSSTFAEGNAGPITLTATESLTFADSTSGDAIRPSGLFTTAIVGTGNAAGITVNTPLLQLTGGARFDATTRTPGQGGNITINADTIAISGERSSPILEGPLFGLVTSLASGIYSRTVQSRSCGGGCGNAGPISVTTGSLSLNQGGRIDNSTTSVGMGGDITINTGQTSIAGTTTNGAPSGVFTTVSAAGSGGHIVLTAGQSVTISNGASVSASSTGPGNAGNISINVGQQLVMQNGTVKTEAAQAGGGNISIQAVDIVRLGNSTISTSVLGGSGSGGNITIDPNVVLLQNSQILAQAVQGAGGNILITTNLLLPDANSTISASSQFGQQGTITIQSPIAPASGKIVPLSQKPLLATSLLNQRCAALAAGEFSSFTVAGRDSLPTEPGGWLTSPMANVGSGAGLEARGEGLPSSPYPLPHWGRGDSEGVLSLRQIAPSGFLTQSFAADELIGCGS